MISIKKTFIIFLSCGLLFFGCMQGMLSEEESREMHENLSAGVQDIKALFNKIHHYNNHKHFYILYAYQVAGKHSDNFTEKPNWIDKKIISLLEIKPEKFLGKIIDSLFDQFGHYLDKPINNLTDSYNRSVPKRDADILKKIFPENCYQKLHFGEKLIMKFCVKPLFEILAPAPGEEKKKKITRSFEKYIKEIARKKSITGNLFTEGLEKDLKETVINLHKKEIANQQFRDFIKRWHEHKKQHSGRHSRQIDKSQKRPEEEIEEEGEDEN